MTRRLWFSLAATVLIVLLALVGNLATDNTPILGLDLQGGVSVILAPTEDAGEDALIGARDQIRTTLERNGIAEPDVRVQGSNLVVDLPGVKDQQEALDLVAVSGIVELRPVLPFTDCDLDAGTPQVTVGDPITNDDGDGSGEESAGLVDAEAIVPVGLLRTAPDDTVPPGDDTVPPGDDTVPPVDDTVPPVDDTVPPVDDTIPPLEELTVDSPLPPTASANGLFPTLDGSILCLGPAQGSGEVFEKDSASTSLTQGWGVDVALRGDGQATWNALAQQCFNATPLCPSVSGNGPGQIAIVLDGVVQSAPQVNAANFTDAVSITGSFTEGEARQLTRVLNRGAFPVPVEAQEARTVSASAGSDSLEAAIIAGLIGVALVLTFLVFYYRWLALVIISGLVVWAATVFSVASFVSQQTNYALSLAGVTGIIVAVGVTVDSYVVFFERMKDEIRNGRTLRNAAPRSFKSTWRTIWSADLVSVIGAGILFWLSVGSVRGFALYLGITTLCDLFVCYCYTRPAVLLLSRSKFMVGRSAFGLEVAPA